MTDTAIETRLALHLLNRELTLATAESCTGGLLGHRLTNVSGCSGFYKGGVITYSYEAKETLLKVAHDTLSACGAVSREVAAQMAEGARALFQADYALAITGIAGPGGGLPGKPVGLVYIALASAKGVICRKHIWDEDRLGNKTRSAEAAMLLLEEVLLGKESEAQT